MDRDKYEEKELIKALSSDGHSAHAAFERLLFLYEKPIWNHLYRLTRDPNEANDLFQETFLKFYNSRFRLKDGGNIKNLLYTIATNTAYDFFRKRKRLSEIYQSDEEDEEAVETKTREEAYSKIEAYIGTLDLEKSLKSLPEHYRNILLLYYRQGFSYAELSDILSLPMGTVKTHLRRAKKALAKEMENYGNNTI